MIFLSHDADISSHTKVRLLSVSFIEDSIVMSIFQGVITMGITPEQN